MLHVCDDNTIPPNVVSRAKAEMTRIYRHAGIDVVWTEEAPQLTLIIVSRELNFTAAQAGPMRTKLLTQLASESANTTR